MIDNCDILLKGSTIRDNEYSFWMPSQHVLYRKSTIRDDLEYRTRSGRRPKIEIKADMSP